MALLLMLLPHPHTSSLSLEKEIMTRSSGSSVVKNLPALWETISNAGDVGLIPGLGRFSGDEMATHPSILAWETPWTEDPGRLQSMRLQKSQT